MLQVTSTYGGCKDWERSYPHQAIDTFHSLYQDQVEEETHSGHLSTKKQKQQLVLEVVFLELYTFVRLNNMMNSHTKFNLKWAINTLICKKDKNQYMDKLGHKLILAKGEL